MVRACETVSPSSLFLFILLFFLLAFQDCPLNLIEASCTEGGRDGGAGRGTFMSLLSNVESSWVGVGRLIPGRGGVVGGGVVVVVVVVL